MPNIIAQILMYAVNANADCEWLREDSETIVQKLTLSDFAFLQTKRAKLKLLSCDVLRNSAILDGIASSSIGACDAYTGWVDAFNEEFEHSYKRVLQATFEIVTELIKLRYDVFNLAVSGHAIIVDELD